jgi:hypothetical protein
MALIQPCCAVMLPSGEEPAPPAVASACRLRCTYFGARTVRLSIGSGSESGRVSDGFRGEGDLGLRLMSRDDFSAAMKWD